MRRSRRIYKRKTRSNVETLIILIGAIVILSVAFYMAREKSYLPPIDIEKETQTQNISKEKIVEAEEEKKEEASQSIAEMQTVTAEVKSPIVETPSPQKPVETPVSSPPKEQPAKKESETIAEKPVPVPQKQEAPPIVQNTAPPKTGTVFTVQVGYFSNEANARSLAKEIEGKGFQAFLITHNNAFKVQVGAYSTRPQAEEASRQLKNLGYEIWLTER